MLRGFCSVLWCGNNNSFVSLSKQSIAMVFLPWQPCSKPQLPTLGTIIHISVKEKTNKSTNWRTGMRRDHGFPCLEIHGPWVSVTTKWKTMAKTYNRPSYFHFKQKLGFTSGMIQHMAAELLWKIQLRSLIVQRTLPIFFESESSIISV